MSTWVCEKCNTQNNFPKVRCCACGEDQSSNLPRSDKTVAQTTNTSLESIKPTEESCSVESLREVGRTLNQPEQNTSWWDIVLPHESFTVSEHQRGQDSATVSTRIQNNLWEQVQQSSNLPRSETTVTQTTNTSLESIKPTEESLSVESLREIYGNFNQPEQNTSWWDIDFPHESFTVSEHQISHDPATVSTCIPNICLEQEQLPQHHSSDLNEMNTLLTQVENTCYHTDSLDTQVDEGNNLLINHPLSAASANLQDPFISLQQPSRSARETRFPFEIMFGIQGAVESPRTVDQIHSACSSASFNLQPVQENFMEENKGRGTLDKTDPFSPSILNRGGNSFTGNYSKDLEVNDPPQQQESTDVDQNFPTLSKLLKTPYECKKCKRKFADEDRLQDHHKNNPYKCKKCCMKFKNKRKLGRHYVEQHPKETPLKCGHCDFACKKKGNLRSHFLKCHETEISSQQIPSSQHPSFFLDKTDHYSSSILSRGGNSSTGNYSEYLEINDPPQQQESLDVDQNFPLLSKLLKTRFECKKCKSKFKDEDSFNTHLCKCPMESQSETSIIRHHKVQTKEKHLKCDQCNYRCAHKGPLIKHIKSCHKSKLSSSLSPSKKKFTCVKCSKGFVNEPAFMKHVIRNNCEFICNECSKKFPSKNRLRKHYKIHTGDPSFPCDECDDVYAFLPNLQKHKNKKHKK